MAEAGNFHRRMQDLMDHPERWHAVDLATLKQLTFFQCLLFGGTGEIDSARKMGRLDTVPTERAGEGDRRVLPLLEGCRERLGRTARARLAGSWSGVAYASLVDFLLGWMERAADEEDLHTVGEALAEIPGRTRQGKVVDVERKFPANAPDDLPPIRVIEEWTIPEYGERIGRRLVAMMKKSPAQMVIPKVLRSWKISPD